MMIDSRVEPAVQIVVRITGLLPVVGSLVATVAQLIFVDHILQRNQIGADRSSQLLERRPDGHARSGLVSLAGVRVGRAGTPDDFGIAFRLSAGVDVGEFGHTSLVVFHRIAIFSIERISGPVSGIDRLEASISRFLPTILVVGLVLDQLLLAKARIVRLVVLGIEQRAGRPQQDAGLQHTQSHLVHTAELVRQVALGELGHSDRPVEQAAYRIDRPGNRHTGHIDRFAHRNVMVDPRQTAVALEHFVIALSDQPQSLGLTLIDITLRRTVVHHIHLVVEVPCVTNGKPVVIPFVFTIGIDRTGSQQTFVVLRMYEVITALQSRIGLVGSARNRSEVDQDTLTPRTVTVQAGPAPRKRRVRRGQHFFGILDGREHHRFRLSGHVAWFLQEVLTRPHQRRCRQ